MQSQDLKSAPSPASGHWFSSRLLLLILGGAGAILSVPLTLTLKRFLAQQSAPGGVKHGQTG